MNRTFISYINQMPSGNNSSGRQNYTFKYGKMGYEIDETTKGLYYLHENLYDSFTDLTDEMMKALEKYMKDYLD